MVYLFAILLALLAPFYTYIIYPLYVNFKFKNANSDVLNPDGDKYPPISIIMSVYNEELVLPDKLSSLSTSKYPSDKVRIFIGSDNSKDKSNEIVSSFSSPFPVFFSPFGKRRGKTRVINDLVNEAFKVSPPQKNHILVFTDANVLLNEETLKELVQPFEDEKVDLVDATMIPLGLENKGISRAEGTYVNFESNLKFQEGRIWGMTMGPFGGCFAMRATAFQAIPPFLVVDDLYLALNVLTKGKKVITAPKANCYEKVSSQLLEELKRKIRISSGNWQLLSQFPKVWFPPFNSTLSFIFISHKLLRWLSPLFILLVYLIGYLWFRSGFSNGQYFFIGLNILFISPFVLDQFLKLFRIPFFIPRKIHYFLMMNFGLLLGFLKYLSGLNTNIWEPPNRK